MTKSDPVDTHDEETAHGCKNNSTNADGMQESVGNNCSKVTLSMEDTLRPVGIHTIVSETAELVGIHQNAHDERAPHSCKNAPTNVEGLPESVSTNRAQITLSIEDTLKPVDVYTAVGETVKPVGTHQAETEGTPRVTYLNLLGRTR